MLAREGIERRLAEIAGVVRRADRRGHGYAYYAGDQEIAHFHGDERLDVRLTRDGIRQRRSDGGFDARVRTRGPSAEWVAVRVMGEQDFPLVISLVQEAVRNHLGPERPGAARKRS
jgi:Family of unknown function (DUF5519)